MARKSAYSTAARMLRSSRWYSTSREVMRRSIAFAFDIDGVLLRSSKPLPGASAALRALRAHNIPFILLTNGGGTSERARVDELSRLLALENPIDVTQFVQSHTPFSEFKHLKDKTALVLGGPVHGHSCREVALSYGFGTVVTPFDICVANPDILPFWNGVVDKQAVRKLPLPLATEVTKDLNPDKYLKIDAAFVFNDPRQWMMDSTVLLDTLLSHQGYLGTLSPKNGNGQLENQGYLQDGQPPIYFSNPDVWWAASWRNPRLGQGAFRAAFEGVFKAATDGAELLHAEQFGKPCKLTYEFAEKKLIKQREWNLRNDEEPAPRLERVYMIGDNPESDIKGANSFISSNEVDWKSILVRSGVYNGGTPAAQPDAIVDDVWGAVSLACAEYGVKLERQRYERVQ